MKGCCSRHVAPEQQYVCEAMNKWTQIKAVCKAGDIERVCAVMSMYDNNLMIEDTSDIENIDTIYGELIDEELLERDRTHGSVSIFCDDYPRSADIAAALRERLSDNGIECELSLEGVKEEDWSNEWKKYYKPLKISPRLTVVPLWEDYTPAENENVLRMDPGMAFGTGSHETTRLCAMLVDKYMLPGSRVLDVGTGSGILAIAASKLGAASVRAYDIDPVAVRIAEENAGQNGCRNVVCAQSDLLKNVSLSDGKYDFVCANIVADIILRMAKDIGKFVNDGGYLAVSGIIDRQAEDVKLALISSGFKLIDTLEEHDWNALLLEKTKTVTD